MPLELHLRIRVLDGKRDEFLAFVAEAVPYYEAPGGIHVRLLEDVSDWHRFIEVVEYADDATYRRDQQRLTGDPQMKEYVARWHTLLDGPPSVEVYRTNESFRGM